MTAFLLGHATHPDWRMALALAAAQLDAQRAQTAGFVPTLGLVYLTDHYAEQAEALLADLQQRWPGVSWVGSVGVGIAATGVEYFDEPALALLMSDLPHAQFQVFSGAQPLQAGRAWSALVHADGRTPDVAGLIGELAERTGSGYLFGGLASSRSRALQIADGVYEGGVSGVGFGAEVRLISRVTQGCQPVGPARRITAADGYVVLRLDDRPALTCLLDDLGIDLGEPRRALPVLRGTLAGVSDAADELLAHRNQFGVDTRVRHLIGLDPARLGVALADTVEAGMHLAFCRRDLDAARRDLTRICSEIREELSPEEELSDVPVDSAAQPQALPPVAPGLADGSPQQMVGAIYVSCAGRGGPHFGGPSAELQLLRHALGDVPLVGFFAGGEIARHHLYGYTGVLTVFMRQA
jgi:small ligand-binding sensory domain FIST